MYCVASWSWMLSWSLSPSQWSSPSLIALGFVVLSTASPLSSENRFMFNLEEVWHAAVYHFAVAVVVFDASSGRIRVRQRRLASPPQNLRDSVMTPSSLFVCLTVVINHGLPQACVHVHAVFVSRRRRMIADLQYVYVRAVCIRPIFTSGDSLSLPYGCVTTSFAASLVHVQGTCDL